MRHGRRRGRLGIVQDHRKALLRNLARSIILRQQIVTTHVRAKETSKFVDQLVTIAKQNTLHARRELIRKLGSGSEDLARRMLDVIAPKFSDRKGGYTRVLHYKNRVGDGASLSLLEFTIPVVQIAAKKRKKTKEPVDSKKHEHPEAHKEKEALKEEAPKKGGFLGKLRRFLKGDDEQK